ncbi:lymphoid enhancer-binding factor 1-like [Antennarius striatus]|uniref:lymphoid enhancer-binding factor 1-like n=1 Tax=Antennarius striatus TaxID=241820 RepID=UPI0035B3D923
MLEQGTVDVTETLNLLDRWFDENFPTANFSAPPPVTPPQNMCQGPTVDDPTAVTISSPAATEPENMLGQWLGEVFSAEAAGNYSPAAPPQHLEGYWSVSNTPTAPMIGNICAAAPQAHLEDNWSVPNTPTAPMHGNFSAALQTTPDIPVGRIPESSQYSMEFVGMLNGLPVYRYPQVLTNSVVAAPPKNYSIYQSKKCHTRNQHRNHPYVKKPPNAFMLFLKEQRPYVHPDIQRQGSGVVNKILGQKWTSLPKEEQDKYYREAWTAREEHMKQHPDWSAMHNYGRKMPRNRCCRPSFTVQNHPSV